MTNSLNIIASAATSRAYLLCELSTCGVGDDDKPKIHGSRSILVIYLGKQLSYEDHIVVGKPEALKLMLLW